jgi:hypothetical protein
MFDLTVIQRPVPVADYSYNVVDDIQDVPSQRVVVSK